MFGSKSTRLFICLSSIRRNLTRFQRNNSSYFHHKPLVPLAYKTISQSFDELAHQYSDEECFVFKSEQKRYTYKKFKEEVDNIAAALIELGFKKNDCFAVWLPNTSENVAISYAASKLGIIKVNINPAYIERELQYCLNKVSCKGIILSPSVRSSNSLSTFRRLVPEIDKELLSSGEISSKAVPSLKHVILTGPLSNLPGVHSYSNLIKQGSQLPQKKLLERQASIDPDSPFEIFYTSGTTGQPKAAMLTHFGVFNLVRAQMQHYNEFFSRLCVPIPMFHIFAEMVGVLNVAVAKCHTTFPDILPDTVATMRAIQEEQCTALIGAPIIFRDILMHPTRKNYSLQSLKFGLSGASVMHMDFLRQVENEFPVARMAQAYGMTETAGIITCSLWAGDEDVNRRLSSIGRPMPGLELKIVDKEGNTLPLGESGEMLVRGHSVLHEYYGEPEKTQETITPYRWLRTGDEGKMDKDGYVYFVGRQKDIIIRGGVNIYPVEVENAITEHPDVAEAQVFSIPSERYGEEACAWIKLRPNVPDSTVDDIRQFLKNRLAFFKIPTYMKIVDKFVMTPTGKPQKFKMSEIMKNELGSTE